jgi:2-oxoglutarate dehydrogenase E2 component (dihydrolipoamide succinyltransferase)
MSETIDIKVPAEQEGTKAIVRSWLVKVGDRVELDGPLVELETDKVTQEVPSPAAGVLTEILLDTDDEAEPGAILGRMTLGAARGEVAKGRDIGHAPDRVTGLSPAVRRAIKEHAVDPATIEGTGRGGRITRADVDKAVAERVARPAPPRAGPPPASVAAGGVTTVPHDRMRLAIAQNMLHSVTAAPHVTAVFECDFSAVAAHRNKHKAVFERDGVKLTLTAYILAACAEAMKAAPAVNSRWYDDRLELFEDVNIGVGTALGEKGLIVPVVRRVQDLSLQGIGKRLSELTARARENTLSGADVAGGTFTVSNHGVSGSLVAAPVIINQPQSAILGVGKLEKRVVVREVDGVDTIQIRPMCYVSLTIDHRVLDGHQTNAWLTKFVQTIESWPET